MRAIVTSVDFSDLLSLTLPYNRHHFKEVLIVTSHADYLNVVPIAKAHGADVFPTNLFYDGGAVFNKWAALEAGLDYFGRAGWLVLMDVDVLWPKHIPGFTREIGKLYTPRRRMADPIPSVLPVEADWNQFPLHPQQVEFAGYSQIFHASDPVLGAPPWHETNWRHAGGADSFFQARWAAANKVRPPFEVLHLGAAGQNWAGRVTPYLDGAQPTQAAKRLALVRAFVRGRVPGPDRFAKEKLAIRKQV